MLAVAILVVVVAVALRGTLPGAAHPQPRQAAPPGPASVVTVVALMAVSLAILTVAAIARLRDPRARIPAPRIGQRWSLGTTRRVRWTMLLVLVALVAAALVMPPLGLRGVPPLPDQSPRQGPDTPPGGTGDPPGTDSVETPPPLSPEPPAILGTVLSVSAVLFVILIAVVVVIMHRRRGTAIAAPDSAQTSGPTDSDADSLVRAAEMALAEVGDTSREPRRAIIACYASMESELELVPATAPRDFDTASEVLARAMQHRALRVGPATRLVELFEEARFSPHLMGEGHRDQAVAALRDVLADLRGAR